VKQYTKAQELTWSFLTLTLRTKTASLCAYFVKRYT